MPDYTNEVRMIVESLSHGCNAQEAALNYMVEVQAYIRTNLDSLFTDPEQKRYISQRINAIVNIINQYLGVLTQTEQSIDELRKYIGPPYLTYGWQ